jgi:hypothetical protein
VSCFAQLTDDSPTIVLFISHEDDEGVMKKLGMKEEAA